MENVPPPFRPLLECPAFFPSRGVAMPRVVLLALLLILGAALSGCNSDEGGPAPIELWVGDNSRPYMPRPVEVAQLVKNDLEAVGFKVEIRPFEWGEYLEKTRRGEHPMCLLGWTTDNADPDNFLWQLLDQDNAVPGSATNVSFFRNQEMHDLLTEAQRTTDVKRRAELYKKAQAIIHREVPMVPLVFAKLAHAMRADVVDFHQNPIGTVRLHTVRFEGKEGGTLIYARGSESVNLDPIDAEDGESIKIIDNVYEGLVEFDLDGTAIRPALAKRWTVSEGGKVWTFDLEAGVRFHDGTPCDAAAVVANFQRIVDGRKGMPYGSCYEMIDSVAAEGAERVVFRLKTPSAVFLANLAMHPASIASPAAFAPGPEALDRKPVGTGAFRLEEWVLDTRLSIVRNEAYWDAESRARLERIVFTVEKEPTARIARLRDNQVQFADDPHPKDFDTLKKDASIKLLVRDGMSFGYLAMNNDKPPFKDNPKLRQAVAHAIDKDRIISRAYAGFGQAAVHPLPPTIVLTGEDGAPVEAYASEIPAYPYDPELARRLLEESGYLATGG